MKNDTPTILSTVNFTGRHLRHAANLFPARIRDRGRRYFAEDRARLDEVLPTGYLFRVNGSAGAAYSVILRSGPGDTLDAAASVCDCPFDDYCKHIWAALLCVVEQTDSGYRSSEPTRPASRIRRERPSSRPASWVQEMLTIPERADTIRDPHKIHRLHFIVENLTGRLSRPEITVRPVMRYIKKDGSPGALSDYRPSAALEPLPPRQLMLLEQCRDRDGRRLDIRLALEYIRPGGGAGLEAVPVHVRRGDRLVPVSLRSIPYITLDFLPKRMGDEPEFRPRMTLPGANAPDAAAEPAANTAADAAADTPATGSPGSVVTFDPAECAMDLRGPQALIFHQESAVLAMLPLEDPMELRAMDLLCRAVRPWFPADIRALESMIPQHRLRITETCTDVRIRSVAPRLLLTLTESRGGLDVDVDYEEKRISRKPEWNEAGWWEITEADRYAAREDALWAMGRMEGTPTGPQSFETDLSLDTFLAGSLVKQLAEREIELRLDWDHQVIRSASKFKIELVSGEDWLDLEVHVDGEPVPASDILMARRLLRRGSTLILLDEEQLERLRRIRALGTGPRGQARLNPDDIGTVRDLGDLLDELDVDDIASLRRTREIIRRLERGFHPDDRPPDTALNATLRPYQAEGLQWLRFLTEFGLGGILADDMGLGKTVQSIALLADSVGRDGSGPHLVAAPLSTIPNWKAEFERFLPAMEVTVHVGSGRGRLEPPAGGTVLTTYQLLVRDADQFIGIPWDLLCLDESQNIKNAATKSYKTVRKLQARRTLALSGTPVENSVMELWSAMNILNPGLLGPRIPFRRRYLKSVQEGNAERINELRRRVEPFILRRTKDVVAAELPSREEIVRRVDLIPEQRRFYNRLKEALRSEVEDVIASSDGLGDFSAGNAILMALLRLRQAAIAPALVGEGPEVSAKLDEVLYLLDTVLAEDHKVLIFSQFVKVLDLLRVRLDKADIPYAYLDGSLGSRAREQAIADFREKHSVFLISLKAGGTGLNLTEADYVFILDPWWNPAVEAQAIDRSHRIGQTRPVIAYRFIAADTVEERILSLQERKRRVARDIIASDSSVVSRMDPGEILELFR